MRQNPRYSSLFEEFPELQAGDTLLPKEVLAHFGLLFSTYALLEAAIQNCYVFWQLRGSFPRDEVVSEQDWQTCYNTLEHRAVASTFGNLVKLVSDCRELSDMMVELRLLKKSRDFFAHNFFREENDRMFSDEAALHLIQGMNLLRHRVKCAEQTVDIVAYNILQTIYHDTDFSAKLAEATSKMKADAATHPRTTFGWEKNL